jgi:F-box domain
LIRIVYGNYRTTLMSSSNLPVDVLQMILEYVDKADLVTLCRVNKVCCSCSQDILYRIIYAENYLQLRICRTLAQATHLARRVRSFSFYLVSITDPSKNLAMALQNMSSLRSLKLCMHGRGRYNILDECTFKLDSFFTDFPCDEYLRNFLNNQPTLTHVELYYYASVDDQFEATYLPNITRVAANLSLLQRLIPGRPISEVKVVGYPGYHIPPIDFFALSTAPIQKLTMTYCFIYTIPFEFLASIFPSLTHLSICMEPEICLDEVRGPLCHFSNNKILNKYHSKKVNGSKTYSLPWIHSGSFTSISAKVVEKIISHFSRMLHLAFNALPFTEANITIGSDSVGSGPFAKGRNVTKCS